MQKGIFESKMEKNKKQKHNGERESKIAKWIKQKSEIVFLSIKAKQIRRKKHILSTIYQGEIEKWGVGRGVGFREIMTQLQPPPPLQASRYVVLVMFHYCEIQQRVI